MTEEIHVCKECEIEINEKETYCSFCKDKINYEKFGEI